MRLLTTLTLTGVLCGFCLSAAGQEIVLNPGETFRYDFESLPLVGHHSGEPTILLDWSYDRASLNPGDSAYWRLWIDGWAWWESTVSLTEAPADWSPGVLQSMAAREKAGFIEISFLPESSGMLRVPGIAISLDVESASGGYDTFGAFIVPEPSPALLFVLGVIGAYGYRGYHRRGGNGALAKKALH